MKELQEKTIDCVVELIAMNKAYTNEFDHEIFKES